MRPEPQPSALDRLRGISARTRRILIAACIFSASVNLLILVIPAYMLQLYDRVLTGRSVETLISLSVIACFLLALMGVMDVLRMRLMLRISGAWTDSLAADALALDAGKAPHLPPGAVGEVSGELEILRKFIAGRPLITFFDAPWALIFLLVMFAIHWAIGLTALAAMLSVLACSALAMSRSTTLRHRTRTEIQASQKLARDTLREAGALSAAGALSRYVQRWAAHNGRALDGETANGEIQSGQRGSSAALRAIGQIAILGVGCYFVLTKEITVGGMLAASLLFGKMLAPAAEFLPALGAALRAREAGRKLRAAFTSDSHRAPASIPSLPGENDGSAGVAGGQGGLRLEMESAYVLPPLADIGAGNTGYALRNISLTLEAGKTLAVLGPSGAGKTALAQLVSGLWPAALGQVRLSGQPAATFSGPELRKHVGYLSQETALFPGSIAENIAQMHPDPAAQLEAVREAAKLADIDQAIRALPKGYDTELREGGAPLSAGLRRRVALARAVFGKPGLLVLDDAAAQLDAEGDAALRAMLATCKAEGMTIVLTTHRPGLLALADQILVLNNGFIARQGTRDEVMRLIAPPPKNPPVQLKAPGTVTGRVRPCPAKPQDPRSAGPETAARDVLHLQKEGV